MNYDEAVKNIWHHTDSSIQDDAALLKELIRYATLAPSGHNTQCWRFQVDKRSISILPDLSRRTPAVDPDDHHLYVSLGCAAENLSLAARTFGLSGEVDFSDEGNGKVIINLEPCEAEQSPLFDAIVFRQCTRSDYDGTPVASAELGMLEAAGTGNEVKVVLLTERDAIERVLEYAIRGNTLQLGNPAFRSELEAWIRFSDSEAIATGDGLSARVTGNPPAPRWLGKYLLRVMLRAKSENDKIARQIRSSAGIAVFVSEVNDLAHWVEAGRCYQRFALQATALGIHNAFINQPVEEATVRPEFARAMVLGGGRPDLVVRFGRGKAMPKSLRRPVENVIIRGGAQ